jgi:hypothetical protein
VQRGRLPTTGIEATVIADDVRGIRRLLTFPGLVGTQAVIVTRAAAAHGAANGEVGGWCQLASPHRTNYGEWAVLMKVMLKVRKLCRAIDIGIENEEEDCAAVEAILKAVPSEYVELLGSKDFAKHAWDTLKAMRVGSDRVKKAKAQRLQWEYKALAFVMAKRLRTTRYGCNRW